MLMKRRGVHAGLVVKVSFFSILLLLKRIFHSKLISNNENFLPSDLNEPLIKICPCGYYRVRKVPCQ